MEGRDERLQNIPSPVIIDDTTIVSQIQSFDQQLQQMQQRTEQMKTTLLADEELLFYKESLLTLCMYSYI